MDYREFLIGDYIAAVEMGDKTPTLTITKVVKDKLESLKNPGKQVTKGIIHFKEIDRMWVLNTTNAHCIAGMFGNETDGWCGKRVTLYAEMVSVGQKKELGIRVKGSPDIDREITVTVQLPRRKPREYRMVRT